MEYVGGVNVASTSRVNEWKSFQYKFLLHICVEDELYYI